MDWRDRPVAVTGAAGFIGSHLTEWLVAQGAEVRAFVHGDPRYRLWHLNALAAQKPPNLRIFGGDLRDPVDLARPVAGADTVFHLGAVTSVAYSYEHRRDTLESNVIGTLNVCEAALAQGVRRMVHTSTAGVYGNAIDGRPITEEHRAGGWNPYTAAKLGADHVVESFHRSFELPAAIVRLFNAYGPRMGRYLIMPQVIEQLLRGPEVRVGELTPTRTFAYVDDLVRAFIAMAEADAAVGEVVHFGSEEAVAMGGLVDRIAQLMGRPCRIVPDPGKIRPKKSEIFSVPVDAGKAHRLLGWQAEVGLDEGLRRTIAWIAGGGYGAGG